MQPDMFSHVPHTVIMLFRPVLCCCQDRCTLQLPRLAGRSCSGLEISAMPLIESMYVAWGRHTEH